MYTKLLLFLFFISTALYGQQTITIGKGNVKGVTVTASSNSNTGLRTLTSIGMLPNPKAASRFLSQTTFGPKMADITAVETQGLEAWLDAQLALPYNYSLRNRVQSLHQMSVDSTLSLNPASGATLANTFVGDWFFDASWFQGVMTQPDQLRWRVGFALSQVFVISRNSAFNGNPHALSSYYDMLNRNAFTNYRTILDSVTYHPAMGSYLTYMNNHATDTTTAKKTYPDENYAREIMQLFSIGLFQLNNDGTEIRDALNKPIPTYNNNDIANLAKVFTGLSWAESQYMGQREKDRWSYTKRMKFFGLDSTDYYTTRSWNKPPPYNIKNAHEAGTKTFLGSTVISRPVNQGQQDIADALNIISNHPNVGPFICRRLIQHLITSNPSKEYMLRVVSKFNNNGAGVKGDMKTVIKAILLDPEARDCCNEKTENAIGHLREPILRYMNINRGLELTSPTGVYRNAMVDVFDKLDQLPLYSPSVFNFYSPTYVPDGPIAAAKKVAPEFQMLNSLSFSNYANGLHDWIVLNNPLEFWNYFQNETYKPDQDPSFNYTTLYPMSKDNRLREYLDKNNLVLAQGRVSPANIRMIENTLKQLPQPYNSAGVLDTGFAERRLRLGLFLILISPEYLINK